MLRYSWCDCDVFCDDLDYYDLGYIISLVIDLCWDSYLYTCDFIEIWPLGKPRLPPHHLL